MAETEPRRTKACDVTVYDKSEHRPDKIKKLLQKYQYNQTSTDNHQQCQFDNCHGMKIVQNINERRNIVVTQQ